MGCGVSTNNRVGATATSADDAATKKKLHREKLKFLRTTHLRSLEGSALSAFAKCWDVRDYKVGTKVYRELEKPAKSMYFIVSGQVKLTGTDAGAYFRSFVSVCARQHAEADLDTTVDSRIVNYSRVDESKSKELISDSGVPTQNVSDSGFADGQMSWLLLSGGAYFGEEMLQFGQMFPRKYTAEVVASDADGSARIMSMNRAQLHKFLATHDQHAAQVLAAFGCRAVDGLRLVTLFKEEKARHTEFNALPLPDAMTGSMADRLTSRKLRPPTALELGLSSCETSPRGKLSHAEIFDRINAPISRDHLMKLELISQLLTYVAYKPGEFVFEQGSSGADMYFVQEGVLEAKFIDEVTGAEEVCRTFYVGDYFGDLAMVLNLPRTAAVQAKEYSLCLRLKQSQWQLFLSILPSCKKFFDEKFHQRIAEQFRKYKVPLFMGIEADKYNLLAKTARVVEVPAGEVVYRKNDVGKTCYIIVHGVVSVTDTIVSTHSVSRVQSYTSSGGVGGLSGRSATPKLMKIVSESSIVSGTVDALANQNNDKGDAYNVNDRSKVAMDLDESSARARSDHARTLELGQLGPGRFFGEGAFRTYFAGDGEDDVTAASVVHSRLHTVTALTRVVLLALDSENVASFFQLVPEAAAVFKLKLALSALTLPAILGNPVAIAFFFRFCEGEFSTENINCLLETEHYVALCRSQIPESASSSPQRRSSIAPAEGGDDVSSHEASGSRSSPKTSHKVPSKTGSGGRSNRNSPRKGTTLRRRTSENVRNFFQSGVYAAFRSTMADLQREMEKDDQVRSENGQTDAVVAVPVHTPVTVSGHGDRTDLSPGSSSPETHLQAPPQKPSSLKRRISHQSRPVSVDMGEFARNSSGTSPSSQHQYGHTNNSTHSTNSNSTHSGHNRAEFRKASRLFKSPMFSGGRTAHESHSVSGSSTLASPRWGGRGIGGGGGGEQDAMNESVAQGWWDKGIEIARRCELDKVNQPYKERAQRIIELFIETGSEQEVNLPLELRRACLESFKSGSYDASLFADVRRNIASLVNDDSLKRFRTSELYQKFLSALDGSEEFMLHMVNMKHDDDSDSDDDGDGDGDDSESELPSSAK